MGMEREQDLALQLYALHETLTKHHADALEVLRILVVALQQAHDQLQTIGAKIQTVIDEDREDRTP
jgi:hypothetical protein